MQNIDRDAHCFCQRTVVGGIKFCILMGGKNGIQPESLGGLYLIKGLPRDGFCDAPLFCSFYGIFDRNPQSDGLFGIKGPGNGVDLFGADKGAGSVVDEDKAMMGRNLPESQQYRFLPGLPPGTTSRTFWISNSRIISQIMGISCIRVTTMTSSISSARSKARIVRTRTGILCKRMNCLLCSPPILELLPAAGRMAVVGRWLSFIHILLKMKTQP